MIVSYSSFKHQHALKSVIFRHWLESVFMFPLLFASPHHFSIQMQMSLSHTVPEHSAFLSSLIFPHRIVFAGSIVLVTSTNQADFHLIAYTGSWDSITSVSASLVALLVLSTWFFIRFWYLCSPSETSEFKFLILQQLCWQRTTENTTILRSPAWMRLDILILPGSGKLWDLSSWLWFQYSISIFRL